MRLESVRLLLIMNFYSAVYRTSEGRRFHGSSVVDIIIIENKCIFADGQQPVTRFGRINIACEIRDVGLEARMCRSRTAIEARISSLAFEQQEFRNSIAVAYASCGVGQDLLRNP